MSTSLKDHDQSAEADEPAVTTSTERADEKAAGRLRAVLGRARGALRAAGRLPGRLWSAAREEPRRAARITLVAFLVLLLVAAGFGWFAWKQRNLDAARDQARTAAEQSLTSLLSYDYRTVGQDVEARQALTTGQFRTEYGALVRDVVTPAAARQQVVTQTTAAGSAVESDAGEDRITVVLFLNQTSTVAGRPDPVFSGSRVRAEMQRVDGRWLVAQVTPV